MNDLEKFPFLDNFLSDDNLISLLLYGNYKFDDTKNRNILIVTTRFIKD